MTSSSRLALTLLGTLSSLAIGCTSEPPAAEPPADAAPPAEALVTMSEATLEVAAELGVRNARMPLPGLLTGGQLTEEQLVALSEAGYTRFVSLRLEDEEGAGWEETFDSEGAYGFSRFPVSGADALTRENVEALAALLDDAPDQPTVLYCGSGNRVGAMIALKALWVDGAQAEEALELGTQAGMTRLADPVRELMGMEPGGSP